jgi:hypothetical protein
VNGSSAVSFICLVQYSRVNSVVLHSSGAGVAAAWGGVQAPPDHLNYKFYVMYIRVINIEPPSGGINAVPVAVARGRDQGPLRSNLHVMYSRIKMLDLLLVGQVMLVLLLPGAETRLLCNVTNVTDTSAYALFQVV